MHTALVGPELAQEAGFHGRSNENLFPI